MSRICRTMVGANSFRMSLSSIRLVFLSWRKKDLLAGIELRRAKHAEPATRLAIRQLSCRSNLSPTNSWKIAFSTQPFLLEMPLSLYPSVAHRRLVHGHGLLTP